MPETKDALQIITKVALEGLELQAREIGSHVSESMELVLSEAASHGQALLQAVLEERINKYELKAALNELKETIEGAVAGEIFDGQRELIDLLKETVIKYLPQLLALI